MAVTFSTRVGGCQVFSEPRVHPREIFPAIQLSSPIRVLFDWINKEREFCGGRLSIPSPGEVGGVAVSKSVTRPFLLCPPLIRHHICAHYPTWGLSLVTWGRKAEGG